MLRESTEGEETARKAILIGNQIKGILIIVLKRNLIKSCGAFWAEYLARSN